MNKNTYEKTTEWREQAITGTVALLCLFLFELFFKWRVIFSESLVLDDAFMVERAIHGKPFNDLGQFIPAFQLADLDSSAGLKFFRALATASNDIIILRTIYLGLFAVACAIFAMLIFRLTKDRIFSALIAVFSFITPFSPILVLFTNGSYNIVYFLLFFSALLVGTYIRGSVGIAKTMGLILAMTSLLLLSAVFVETGFLFSFAALLWIFMSSKAFDKLHTGLLFLLSGALILAQAVWILLTYTSPYEAMPGRVNYDLSTMFLNGLSIINRSVASYWEPMIGTGQLTLQSSLWVSISFISLILILYAVAILKLLYQRLDWKSSEMALSFSFFMSVCVVLSIGPYTALTRTHLWHYFPHMIFLCTISCLLLYIIVSKRMAYILVAVIGLLTVQTYVRQIPEYEQMADQQRLFSNFVQLEHESWQADDRIFLIVDGPILAGLNSPFRSTGFGRYVSGNPEAPILSIVNNNPAPQTDAESNLGSTYLYRMDQTGAYSRTAPN